MEKRKSLNILFSSRKSIDCALKLLSIQSKQNLILNQETLRQPYIRKTSRKILKFPFQKTINKDKENNIPQLQIIGSKERIKTLTQISKVPKISKKRMATPEIISNKNQLKIRPCTTPLALERPRREVIKVEINHEFEESNSETESNIIMVSRLKDLKL
ncbi:hypothetical protein SteCoe_27873 [Stentor coeruleus]|uniref:Uncharacterized protein n=1 Tax=Stentor coeruleus TaxID=5963 RepID=A0A1R2B9K7_9CILI|nr:hypothetical protein SteCoe_27873 [Stentor coeruleus]